MNPAEPKPAHILVVDDTPENLHVLTRMLAKQGYAVHPAINGQVALNVAAKILPDLILLDIMMPGMSGYEVCQHLKAAEATRPIPVIFLSARDELADKVNAFELGGVDYITKPFQVEEILARVQTHLTIRKLQQQLQDENDRFRGLSEATFEGLLIHEQGCIIEVNQMVETLTGYTRAELLGRNALDLLTKDSQAVAAPKIRTDTAQPYEIQGRKKDGTLTLLEIQVKTIHYQGRALQVLALRDILSWKRLEQENLSLKASLSTLDQFGEFIGKSPAMQKVYARIVSAAATDDTVIIYGETGTGKELAARTIFQSSAQHARSFVPVNCGALQETLFESQFFGYRKGACTGAERDTPGYLDQAQGGMLFLDEVGELTLTMQAKLLRVLQDREYTPVGATTSRTADVRIIAATNRELRKLVREGKVREDFFHRLHVIALDIPPLRFHKEDIPLLIPHFLEQYAPSGGAAPAAIPTEIVQRLLAYDWPGNVRELFNELRRYLATGEIELAGGPLATAADLMHAPFLQEGLSLNQVMEAFEKFYLTRVLQQCAGHRGQVADQLGIDRKTLYTKLKRYNIA